MQIFVSWSKTPSKELALEVQQLLEMTIQGANIFLSLDSIESGARWLPEISKSLDDCNFGILCLTRENLNEPWIQFEAGALSKSLANGKVVPLLFGIEPSDLNFPIKQFQARVFEKEDFYRLLEDLNSASGELMRKPDQLRAMYEKFWDDVETKCRLHMKLGEGVPRPAKNESEMHQIARMVSEIQASNATILARLSAIESTQGKAKIKTQDFETSFINKLLDGRISKPKNDKYLFDNTITNFRSDKLNDVEYNDYMKILLAKARDQLSERDAARDKLINIEEKKVEDE